MAAIVVAVPPVAVSDCKRCVAGGFVSVTSSTLRLGSFAHAQAMAVIIMHISAFAPRTWRRVAARVGGILVLMVTLRSLGPWELEAHLELKMLLSAS